MKEKINKLVSLLTEMLALYRAVLELGKQKRTALVANDVIELNGITKKEEAMLVEIGKHEAARTAAVRNIAAMHGLDGEKTVISHIIGLVDEKTGAVIDKLRSDLNATAEELQQINEINTSLIKQASFFVNYNMNLLMNNVADNTYTPGGSSGQTAHLKKLLDRKI